MRLRRFLPCALPALLVAACTTDLPTAATQPADPVTPFYSETTVESCQPGTWSPSGGMPCQDADPGHFVNILAATEQTPCAAGRYQPDSGAVSCIIADPGHFVPTPAATEQTACSPGYYQPVYGAVECLASAIGYYVPGYGATEQLYCPAGTSGAASSCGYDFTGFFQPVDNTALNTVKAGRAIPIKFSLDGDHGLDIMAEGYPASAPTDCDDSASTGDVGETVSAGASSLSYDPATDQYTYVWKTDRGWGNSCRTLTVRFDDGTEHTANFKFLR